MTVTFSDKTDEKDAAKTAAILSALKVKYTDHIWAAELRLSSGARRCDFWVLQPHASKGYLAQAFEIKVSRADFKRDHELKQRDSRLFSDRFWYVTPPGLVKPEEVPVWAGLREFDGKSFKTKVEAPHRDKDAPSWELMVSLLRCSEQVSRDAYLIGSPAYMAKLEQRIALQQKELDAWRSKYGWGGFQ